MEISEPGTISAATSGNAAEDGSRGTEISVGRNSTSPITPMRSPPPCGATDTSAPKARSMRSVWSRVSAFCVT